MNILSPSILSANFNHLGQDISTVYEAGAQWLHIDVMDGLFVPSISFGMPVISSIRKETDVFFDVHLMIVEPEKYIEEFAKSGAQLITFHLEATKHADKVIKQIHELGLKAGISIKPQTSVDELKPYLKDVDLILIMSVEPGFGGQKYMELATEKIKQTKAMIEESGRTIDLEVDGGIGASNVGMVLEAGANVIVAGSAVFKGDIAQNVKALLEQF